jgi:hypothetical protein
VSALALVLVFLGASVVGHLLVHKRWLALAPKLATGAMKI